jgi:hypothetical protein
VWRGHPDMTAATRYADFAAGEGYGTSPADERLAHAVAWRPAAFCDYPEETGRRSRRNCAPRPGGAHSYADLRHPCASRMPSLLRSLSAGTVVLALLGVWRHS